MTIPPDVSTACGAAYADGWVTPYIRLLLPQAWAGRGLHVSVLNPDVAGLEGNNIQMFVDLQPTAETGALGCGGAAELVTTLPQVDREITLTLRSDRSWAPPAPDLRRLSYLLGGFKIR